jgi:hypothetical protein
MGGLLSPHLLFLIAKPIRTWYVVGEQKAKPLLVGVPVSVIGEWMKGANAYWPLSLEYPWPGI